MSILIARYFMLIVVALAGFMGFVSCGAKNYKVSLNDDSISTAAANNPESPYFGIHSPKGWSNLPIQIQYGENVSQDKIDQVNAALGTWELVTGVDLFEDVGTHVGYNGDTFKDLYSSLSDAINGNYLDTDWDKTGKPSLVLATTIWENNPSDGKMARADIRYNTQYYTIGDSLVEYGTDENPMVDLQSLATHEVGHFIGLAHVSEDIDLYSIMNPALYIGEGLTTRKVSRQDVERIQKIYGCNGNACDHDWVMEQIEYYNENDGTSLL